MAANKVTAAHGLGFLPMPRVDWSRLNRRLICSRGSTKRLPLDAAFHLFAQPSRTFVAGPHLCVDIAHIEVPRRRDCGLWKRLRARSLPAHTRSEGLSSGSWPETIRRTAPPRDLNTGVDRTRVEIICSTRNSRLVHQLMMTCRLSGKSVSSARTKNFSLSHELKSLLSPLRSVPSAGGALRDRHECQARDAMDVAASRDERCCGGRRSRVVPMPRRWHQVGDDACASRM